MCIPQYVVDGVPRDPVVRDHRATWHHYHGWSYTESLTACSRLLTARGADETIVSGCDPTPRTHSIERS